MSRLGRSARSRIAATRRRYLSGDPERRRIVGRHVALGLLVEGTAIALGAPALAFALTYLLGTAAVAAPFLPNAAAEIRAQARHAAVYVAACAVPFRLLVALLQHASDQQLAEWFGADVGNVARTVGVGILPTIYFFTLASVPLAWTSWLVRQWALHRRGDDFETQLLRARRTDTYQY